MQTDLLLLPQRRLYQGELPLALEVAPEVKVAPHKPTMRLRRTGMHVWRQNDQGSFDPVVETHPAVMPLNKWTEKDMGVPRQIVAILIQAGFVSAEQVSPRRTLVHLESWFAHRERVRADPYFWTEDRKKAYSRARSVLRGYDNRPRKGGRAQSAQSPQDAPEAPPALQTPETAETPVRTPAKGQSAQT